MLAQVHIEGINAQVGKQCPDLLRVCRKHVAGNHEAQAGICLVYPERIVGVVFLVKTDFLKVVVLVFFLFAERLQQACKQTACRHIDVTEKHGL